MYVPHICMLFYKYVKQYSSLFRCFNFMRQVWFNVSELHSYRYKIVSMLIGTKLSETLDFCFQLTRMIAREAFISFSHRESFNCFFLHPPSHCELSFQIATSYFLKNRDPVPSAPDNKYNADLGFLASLQFSQTLWNWKYAVHRNKRVVTVAELKRLT